MGMGHVPQDPFRSEGTRPDVQGRQRRRAALPRDLGVASDLGKPEPGVADQSRLARGRWGEEQAARWYLQHGYEIVDRNWRVREGEVDLIVVRGRLVVFAEVKTRATDSFGDPSLAVTSRKQQRIRRLAAIWLHTTDVHGVDVRFDVVAVLGVHIRVIEAAF